VGGWVGGWGWFVYSNGKLQALLQDAPYPPQPSDAHLKSFLSGFASARLAL